MTTSQTPGILQFHPPILSLIEYLAASLASPLTHAVCRRSSVIPIITTPLSDASGPCCYDICKLQSSVCLHPHRARPPPPTSKPPAPARAVTCEFPRRSPPASVRIFTRPPPLALSCLSRRTPCGPPTPPARSRRAAALAPHSLLSAPLPQRPAVPDAASSSTAAPPRPASPRLHRRSRWRTSAPHPHRPLSGPRGRWDCLARDARTRSKRPGPGTRARALPAARPHRGASPAHNRIRRSPRREGEGPGAAGAPHSPSSRQPIPVPLLG